MSTELTELDALTGARRLVDTATEAVDNAVVAAGRLTEGGRNIDDHQVHAERIAQLATEVRAAREMVAYGERQAAAEHRDALAEEQAFAFAAEAVHRLRGAVEADPDTFDLDDAMLERLNDAELRSLVRSGLAEARVRAIGVRVLEARGAHATELEDQVAALTRDQFRTFAKTEVAPIAQEMHRQDHLVPETLIGKMAELGLFGSSVPESYGGTEMGYLTMVVLTEELSAASLVAGSLITRSEILTRALLQGGTEAQRRRWLPRIASGEVIVGICVTEPDLGSDVASIKTRADKDGDDYVINGGKMWITSGTQADWACLLVNTSDGNAHRNKSLICVPLMENGERAKGVTIERKLKKMGMHSSDTAELHFEDVRVPQWYRIGEEGEGFTYQMMQFQEERLYAALSTIITCEKSIQETIDYTRQRQAFGRSILDNQVVHFRLAELMTEVEALRSLTWRAVEMHVRGGDWIAGAHKRFHKDVNGFLCHLQGVVLIASPSDATSQRRHGDGVAALWLGFEMDFVSRFIHR